MRTKKILWPILTIFIITFVVWHQSKLLFDSGLFDSNGNLVFFDSVIFRDSLVHLSLVMEMLNRFPPTNFASGGEPLKNYHYLFDASLALIAKVTALNVLDLYFRIMPLVISGLLCVTIFITTYKLTNNRFFASISVFFTIIGTSFGSLMPHIKIFLSARSVTGGNNMFMTDQLSNMLINPQGVFALVLFLTLFLLLYSYAKKPRLAPLIVYSLILGTSFGIKAYGGIVFALSGMFFSFAYLALRKDFRPLVATSLGIALIFVWFQFTIDRKVAGINWMPFWLLDVMYNDLDRLNEPSLPFVKTVYLNLGAWHHVARLTAEQFVAYLLGSLGLRIVGLVGLLYFIKSLPKLNIAWLFVLSGAAASFTIPLFFKNQFSVFFADFSRVISVVFGGNDYFVGHVSD